MSQMIRKPFLHLLLSLTLLSQPAWSVSASAPVVSTLQSLQQAVLQNQPGLLRQALAGVKDPQASFDRPAQNLYGVNLLMLAAAQSRDPAVIQILLAAGFPLNAGNQEGLTALMLAARSNPEPKIFQALLAAGANPHLLSLSQSNLLHQAVLNPNPDIPLAVLHLLSPQALHAHNDAYYTPLHEAAYGGRATTVKALLAAGAVSDLHAKVGAQETALHLAAGHNPDPQVIQALLQAGAQSDLPLRNSQQNLPLHLAAESGNVAVLNVLLAAGDGRHLHTPGAEGQLPLHLAAADPDLGVLKRLLNTDAQKDLRVKTPQQVSVLSKAAQNENAQALPVLLQTAAIQDLHQVDALGMTALHFAAMLDKAQNIADLLKAGMLADIHRKNKLGETPLHLAAMDFRCQGRESLQILLKAGAQADLMVADNQGETPLHRASLFGCAADLSVLLEAGAGKTLHLRTQQGSTPLHLAMISHAPDGGEKLRLLLKAGAGQDLHVTANNGDLPLHAAANAADTGLPRLKLLLAQSSPADLKALNANGESVLFLAVTALHDNPEIVRTLLQSGVRQDDQAGKYYKQRGFLHWCAYMNKPETLRVLLAHGWAKALESEDEDGQTALHLAVERGSRDVAKILLEAGASLQHKNHAGATALDLARPQPNQPESTAALLVKAWPKSPGS